MNILTVSDQRKTKLKIKIKTKIYLILFGHFYNVANKRTEFHSKWTRQAQRFDVIFVNFLELFSFSGEFRYGFGVDMIFLAN